MLTFLCIQNYALIEKLEINFIKGFSTITGETGAGKSVMMGAIQLLLGQRAEATVLKNPNEKSVIEAHWGFEEYDLKSLFEEYDVDYDDNSIIRREIMPSGKSRAFVNDMPVNLAFLKELGNRIIDIHSQHQNLLLNTADFQLSVVDSMAKNKDLFDEYSLLYKKYNLIFRELKNLKEKEAKKKENYDFISFQYSELKQANFHDGEQDELETELKELEHAEEIQNILAQSISIFNNEEVNLISQLKTLESDMRKIVPFYSKAEEYSQRIESTLVELQDMSSDIEANIDRISVNPECLAQVRERLDLLYTLLQKHRLQNVAELVAKKDDLEKELQETDSYSEKIIELQKSFEQIGEDLQKSAIYLTESRKNVFGLIENNLMQMLHVLGMANAKFTIQNTQTANYTETGQDCINFLFSANKNGTMQNISDTASGGEISRVMLCLKAIISKSKSLPTIIFDEIDTGVSGDIADKMGDIMIEMGKNMQVISITHLPQIAAKGVAQYKVYKYDTESSTITNIKRLTDDERVNEIAKMLSGSELTTAAIENAKQLLNKNGI